MPEPRVISLIIDWQALRLKLARLLGRAFPQYLPAWLMSLVVHLSLVLLLAVLQVVGAGSWHGSFLAVDAGGADGLGDEGEGLMAQSIALPGDLGLGKSEELAGGAAESLPERPLELSSFALGDSQLAASNIGGLSLSGDGAGAGQSGGGSEGALGHGDGPVHTQVFGLAGEGSRFVYVFDRSESMNSVFSYTSEGSTVFSITPLEAAKAELLKSLNDLDRRHHFHIVFYNHEPWLFDSGHSAVRLVPASRENKRRAAAFIQTVYGQGNTNHMKPLEIALRMKPDVIFLLTDGEAKDDPTRQQLQQIKKLNGDRTRINVVQFCYGQRRDSVLVQLAEENGGKHLFIDIAGLGPGMHKMAGAGQ